MHIDFHQDRREEKWLPVVLWTGIIYASAAFVRPICEFLRSMAVLNLTVTVVLAIFLALFIGRVVVNFHQLTWGRKIALAAVMLMYAWITGYLKIPEEKVHLFQYGILAYLTFHAFRIDFSVKHSYGLAFLATFILGFGDEIIQSFAPGRFYDNKDVVLNGLSGFLGLVLTFLQNPKDTDEIHS